LLKNENIFSEQISETDFTDLALELFRFQYQNNKVFKQWTDYLRIEPESVLNLHQIPFLPIEFFKNHKIISSPFNSETVTFTSSSTTSQVPSQHFVNDVSIYENSFLKGFKRTYGDPTDYCILALLPHYLERSGSSLVYMCKKLIELSGHPSSGFYLNNLNELAEQLQQLKRINQKTLLIGLSSALIDLSEIGIELNEHFIVMETGGMKGTRKEMLKPELHALLKKRFNINSVHSEYGMTELLSQAYSKDDALFEAPPWMRFFTREIEDPLKIRADGKTGGINVIDLANINSCSFIATKDLGRLHPNNKLELMGRYDNSDVRGCNLMLMPY
jgi:phenylacetate-coenzyme A ligase PaaK-like adenylate-forming protein